jgi:hypothetical protein
MNAFHELVLTCLKIGGCCMAVLPRRCARVSDPPHPGREVVRGSPTPHTRDATLCAGLRPRTPGTEGLPDALCRAGGQPVVRHRETWRSANGGVGDPRRTESGERRGRRPAPNRAVGERRGRRPAPNRKTDLSRVETLSDWLHSVSRTIMISSILGRISPPTLRDTA